MRPQQKVETYPDGIVDIYADGDGRTAGPHIVTLRFENKTIGIQRYYDAQNSVKSYTIALVIKVHHTALFSEMDYAVIGSRQYRIRKIQTIPERGVDLLELESVKVKIVKEANNENVPGKTDRP